MRSLLLLGQACILLATPALRLAAGAGSVTDDAEVLMRFKGYFINGGTVLSSWNGSQDPCKGGWLGVKCDNLTGVNRVSQL